MATIRPAQAADLPAISALDERETGVAKPDYWRDMLASDPRQRQRGIASALFEALIARFKERGVTRVRTLVDRKDHLILSFFRAQGMVAGPSLQLDMDVS